MEIAQAQQMKADLENAILHMICAFENKTGVEIHNVELRRVQTGMLSNAPATTISDVAIEVRL